VAIARLCCVDAPIFGSIAVAAGALSRCSAPVGVLLKDMLLPPITSNTLPTSSRRWSVLIR
jgi:hypothetical protein